MYTYNQLKNGDKTLQQVEKEQKKIKSELNEIRRGSKKSENQKRAIENIKNCYKSRQKMLIFSMANQEIDLNPFTNQNKIKLKEQDLNY